MSAFCCALAMVCLPGKAQAGAPPLSPVDLSAFYTTGFEKMIPEVPGLPRGQQTFGGIPFQIGGKLEVTGTDAARHGEFLSPQIIGIPINQQALRIELIHGARHGQKDGTPLANVVFHFKNGETRKVRLAFGVHARNYLEEISSLSATQSVRQLADPNSQIVWRNHPASTNEPLAQLYQTTIANPLPDQQISTIDFVSLFSRATPILFAITLDNAPKAAPLLPVQNRKVIQRAAQFDDGFYRADLKVHVTDGPGGKPVANATAILTIKDDARSFFFGQYKSDNFGQLTLSYPPQQAVSLSLRVSSPGFVPASVLLTSSESQKWPETLDMVLQHGNPIGGFVLDSKGKPIEGAAVIPYQITQIKSNEYTRTDFDVLKTDSTGKWIGTAQSESLSNLSFEVRHPEFHSAFKQLAGTDLLATKAMIKLDPHLRIIGRLTANGAPVSNGTVLLDTGDSRNVESRRVDSDGRFSFIVRDATNNTATIIATAKDYAPGFYAVSLGTQPAALNLLLEQGSTFRMRLVDQNGSPVPAVKISLVRWAGSSALQWRTVTDEQGHFVWEHAPAGSVTFRYEKPGHSTHTHSMTLPSQGETTFTYTRMNRVFGKVIDAETKKPIDQFTWALRYRYINNTPKRWYRYTAGTGRKGTFSSSSSGGISQAEWSLVIEARGYDPAVSDMSLSGTATNVYELKKGTPLIGMVVTTDGSPVAKADVVLLDGSTSASMDVPGRIRKTSSYYDIVSSDASGRFELTRKPEPDVVIATHPQFGYGQALLDDVLKTGKIMLQRWGYVRGVLRVGDKVEPYQHVALHSNYQVEGSNGRSQPPLYVYYKGTPDSNGRFSFDMVPPGNRMVYLHYQLQERETGTMKLSHNVSVLVKPGETNEVVIGGTGRKVIGKVKTSGANIEVDWHRDSHVMRLINPPPGVPPPFSFPPNANAEERQKLIKERNAALQDFYREQNRRNMLDRHEYVLLFNDDGSFWVPNVSPGRYNINVSLTDPRQPNNYRQIGNMNSEVVIPEGQTPHDIGVLNLTLHQ